MPPDFQPGKRYPLLVQVFGGNVVPTKSRPFIRIRPSARGVWGYRSMSRYDVLQAIARTKDVYNIDDDRVYITGTSAGATGVMHVAAQRPDLFAGIVPLVAFGNDLPLKNFRNLPIRCEHGVNDWTSAIGNVRVQSSSCMVAPTRTSTRPPGMAYACHLPRRWIGCLNSGVISVPNRSSIRASTRVMVAHTG